MDSSECSKGRIELFSLIDMVVVIPFRIGCRKLQREDGNSFLLLILFLFFWWGGKHCLSEIIHLKMRWSIFDFSILKDAEKGASTLYDLKLPKSDLVYQKIV